MADNTVETTGAKPQEDWMARRWRPMMGWMYMVVCTFDFMVAPILWLETIQEFKTKPLQNAVRSLNQQGLQADIILCRTTKKIPNNIVDKIFLDPIKFLRRISALEVSSASILPVDFFPLMR